MKRRTMPFLINPPRPRGTTVTTKRKSGARKRRNPPKGYRSWKAWMAHIRPGAKRRARPNPHGGTTVKRGTGKRRKAHALARRNPSPAVALNPPRRRRGRSRRNPPIMRELPRFVGGVAYGAVCATGGKVAVRKASALMRQTPGSVFALGTQALLGLGLGYGLAMVHPQTGRDVALGGVQAALETALTRMKVPVIADALGADDYYLGFSDGVDALNTGSLGGYVEGTGSQFGEEVGELGAPDSGARFMVA